MSLIAFALLLVVYALAAPAVIRATDPTIRYGAIVGAVVLAAGLLATGFVPVEVVLSIWVVMALVVAVVIALILLRRAGQISRTG